LVRNLGALYYFRNIQKFNGPIKGDFSLNVTNHQTFQYLIQKGLDSVCLSYDLNLEQTVSLLQNVDASKAEITIHQSMPSFHMEHCVFAAFLSKGKSYKDCGKPCEKHKVQLKDQFGHYHWIKPDQECRNTMYNASAQTALPYLESWLQLGLGEIRYEALHEQGPELIKKIRNYIDVLTGQKSLSSALADLETTELYGLSPRQLDRSEEYQARKKDHRFL
jgi:putative protease